MDIIECPSCQTEFKDVELTVDRGDKAVTTLVCENCETRFSVESTVSYKTKAIEFNEEDRLRILKNIARERNFSSSPFEYEILNPEIGSDSYRKTIGLLIYNIVMSEDATSEEDIMMALAHVRDAMKWSMAGIDKS